MTNKASSFPGAKPVIICTAVAAFVTIAAVVMFSTGGARPKPCADILQTELFSCDMAKESQK